MGVTCSYNCRDGPWFMLQNIQDYVNMAPKGLSLLKDTVQRRFPLDDEWVPFDSPKAFATTTSIADLIQEILQRHAEGIHFREYNAGPNLDSQMSDQGFNIDIDVDWSTGILYGGNAFNCGTWQDKMVSGRDVNTGTYESELTRVCPLCRARAPRPATRACRARRGTGHRSRSSVSWHQPCAGSPACRPRGNSLTRACKRRVSTSRLADRVPVQDLTQRLRS